MFALTPSLRLVRTIALAAALVVVAACSSSGPNPSSALPSTAASETAAGNLPPGCAPQNLFSPSGERLELDGTWVEVGTAGSLATWWLRTQGDCIWGSGHVDEIPPTGTVGARPDQVQSFSGRIGSDFAITGEILFLGPVPFAAPQATKPYSPLEMAIQFGDDGEILLRELREPGVTGPRCPDPAGFCPAPLVLKRAE